MSTVTNPLQGLIDGLLQGHALGQQLHRQQQQDQAFKTQQILDNQRISSEQIMQQMREADNRAKLADDYRPVSDLGTVQDKMNLTLPGSQGSSGAPQPDIYNLPQQGGASMPGPQFNYDRKADGARTINYQGQKFERKTPEELRARDLERHISDQSALEKASVKAKGEADESELNRKRLFMGVPVPEDLAQLFPAAQYPHGILQKEIMDARSSMASARNANYKEIPKEGTLVDVSKLGPDGKPSVIAQGAPKDRIGEDAYLQKYAEAHGKTKAADLSMEDYNAALGEYKAANADQDTKAATLAGKAAALATADLARTMKQIAIGQMPTKEDAARMAEHIRNHEFAPSQITEIRGRGNGSLGIMIEREMAKADPHFSWQQADADYGFSKTPGFQSTVRLMDSATNSLGRLQSAANTLNQGNVRSINNLIKLGKSQFNGLDLKRFQTDALLVGDEIGKIIQGGGTGSGVSDAKLKQASEIFKDTDNPKAIATAIQEVQAIIGYRRQTMTRGTAYEGQAAPPEAAGSTSYAQTATGKDGHKIGTNDGGKTWYDAATGQKVQ